MKKKASKREPKIYSKALRSFWRSLESDRPPPFMKVKSMDRWTVYRRARGIRTYLVLKATFPRTEKVLGPTKWNLLGKTFSHHSKESNLNLLGRRFSAFLSRSAERNASAMARFEWTIAQLKLAPPLNLVEVSNDSVRVLRDPETRLCGLYFLNSDGQIERHPLDQAQALRIRELQKSQSRTNERSIAGVPRGSNRSPQQ